MENWQSIFTQVERLKRDVEIKLQLFELYYEKQMTLQQIGDRFGVTRERIRQIMDRLIMPRYTSYGGSRHRKSKFKTISEYFKHVKNVGKDNYVTLAKFISPLKKRCKYCNSTKRLHTHHLKYPAESLDDIEMLCCSCHLAEHRGIRFDNQTEIGDEYLQGKNGVELANQYNVSNGTIYHILRKRKIPRRSRRWSRPLDKNLKRANIYV